MRAGASTALVHHYFSTREELLEQALLHSFEQAGDERFAEADGEAPTATAALAAAIEECLPRPGRLERDWVLWVELWLRAAREPDLRPLAASLYARYHEWLEEVLEARHRRRASSPPPPTSPPSPTAPWRCSTASACAPCCTTRRWTSTPPAPQVADFLADAARHRRRAASSPPSSRPTSAPLPREDTACAPGRD